MPPSERPEDRQDASEACRLRLSLDPPPSENGEFRSAVVGLAGPKLPELWPPSDPWLGGDGDWVFSGAKRMAVGEAVRRTGLMRDDALLSRAAAMPSTGPPRYELPRSPRPLPKLPGSTSAFWPSSSSSSISPLYEGTILARAKGEGNDGVAAKLRLGGPGARGVGELVGIAVPPAVVDEGEGECEGEDDTEGVAGAVGSEEVVVAAEARAGEAPAPVPTPGLNDVEAVWATSASSDWAAESCLSELCLQSSGLSSSGSPKRPAAGDGSGLGAGSGGRLLVELVERAEAAEDELVGRWRESAVGSAAAPG